MQESNHVTLSVACDFDERTAWEVGQKGWFEQAIVHLPDGSKVPVCFWDPGRQSQDLETDLKIGENLIVIPQVTLENMKAAVEELYNRGYFNQLRSLFQ